MSLALVRQAAEQASASTGPLHGYPPWLIVLIGAFLAVILLWIFAKLVKWTIWIVIFVVLVGGLITAYQMFFNPSTAVPPTQVSTPTGPRP